VSYDAIGRRYAKAIFDLAKEEGSLAAVSTAMNDLAGAYTTSSELRDVLDSPLVPDDARNSILVELASRVGANDTAKRALRIVGLHRRLRALPDIARHLAKLVDEDAKIVRAIVTSAGPLSESYISRLKSEIERATGKKVNVVHTVDPSLIAGVITQIGDRVVDGSARSGLRSLRNIADRN
jgi:F-type H+-transporting ATPase subunit delta